MKCIIYGKGIDRFFILEAFETFDTVTTVTFVIYLVIQLYENLNFRNYSFVSRFLFCTIESMHLKQIVHSCLRNIAYEWSCLKTYIRVRAS